MRSPDDAVPAACIAIIPAMHNRQDEHFKTALQIVAVVCLLGLFSMIFHKAFADISLVWQQHSGGDFWVALGRYLFRNLAG